MNPDVQKLIEEYGEPVMHLAEKIERRYANAASWGDGWNAAYQDSIRLIGKFVRGQR